MTAALYKFKIFIIISVLSFDYSRRIKRQGKKSRVWGTETPEPIATKFCMPGAVHDVIMHANFCEDWYRGFGVARGRILAFSIDLLRRL